MSSLTSADCTKLKAVPQLKKINLKDNAINNIADDCFSGLPLEALFLQDNDLATLREAVLDNVAPNALGDPSAVLPGAALAEG